MEYSKEHQLSDIRKLRKRKCKSCGLYFRPEKENQRVCSEQCAIEYAIKNKHKYIKREKAKAKKKLNENDTGHLKRECQKIANKIGKVNAYLIHDIKHCVTCGIDLSTQLQVDGGHCFPTSTYSGIRFYTHQIFPQCVKCNRHNSGMRIEFESFLVELYGKEKVDWLRSHKGKPTRYTAEYLRRYRKIMGKRLKILEERLSRKSSNS